MSSSTSREPAVNLALAKEHGLTESEYEKLVKSLGRTPTFTELGIVSVMWSEHCSYKSSRKLLKTLPTEGPAVVQGPGENAGAVSVGDGEAVVFKIESHNHPSAVEPYQGATTGVGGILRDIFTMGARPIAMLDSLRFGDIRDPKVRQLAHGVVKGIADYGNCVGVPTVAGEVYFDRCYEGNPLVNAMCVGRIRVDMLTKAAAKTVGGLVIYFGNPTGRDGVHGATFASEELSEETRAQRSAVQVGDPFMGKKILEATLDLINAGVIEGIQDMGAAGLTCSSCEMGSSGGRGVRFDLDEGPRRDEGLTPYEIMVSESQERMLVVCHPRDLKKVEAILGRWDLKAHVIGEVTNDGNLRVVFEGKEVACLSNHLLTDEAPLYDLPRSRPEYLDRIPQYKPPSTAPTPDQLKEAALALLAHPNIASKRWIHEQYDTQVQTATVQKPGGSAAVVRLKDYNGSDGRNGKAEKQIALKADCNGLFCYLDPREGAKLAVAECARNLVCVGAEPLGATNCLNFGNPNKPGVFWQFAEVIAGMGEACRKLGTPITGGNVSFYNESPEGAVFPTPVIGMVGLVRNPVRVVTPFFPKAGLDLWILGPDPTTLGGSQYAQIGSDRPVGPCPKIDLDVELKVQRLMLNWIESGVALTAQDLSDGGLWIAAAEGAIGGNCGCKLSPSSLSPKSEIEAALWLFSEDPSRILFSAESASEKILRTQAQAEGLTVRKVGRTEGQTLNCADGFEIEVERARGIYYNEAR